MCKENMYKNRLKYGLKLETGVCCTYKQCTNYTKCMKMLIESYVLLLMYDLCIQDPNILYFSNFCFNNDAIFRAILQLCKILGPMFSYSKRFTDESILSIYLVLIQFISILIFLFFFLYIFSKCIFFDILFIKTKVIFINFPMPYFLAKKAVKFIFLNTANSISIRFSQIR